MYTDTELNMKERLEEAAATAKMIMEQSGIVGKMVLFRIECLRLLVLADAVLENELKYGWDIDEGYVLDILKASACECAVQKLISASELQRAMTVTILPLLEILAIQEEAQQ